MAVYAELLRFAMIRTTPLSSTYRGLSQYELAERIGTPIWVVAEWEAGDRAMRLEDAFRLFRVLEITPQQLFQRPR